MIEVYRENRLIAQFFIYDRHDNPIEGGQIIAAKVRFFYPEKKQVWIRGWIDIHDDYSNDNSFKLYVRDENDKRFSLDFFDKENLDSVNVPNLREIWTEKEMMLRSNHAKKNNTGN
ncbi:MAG: hypothetical protein FWD87_11090 [Spirochaetaceae bacterium]|nr:hypothetical protein [Spirochaetaceae bacterium]